METGLPVYVTSSDDVDILRKRAFGNGNMKLRQTVLVAAAVENTVCLDRNVLIVSAFIIHIIHKKPPLVFYSIIFMIRLKCDYGQICVYMV